MTVQTIEELIAKFPREDVSPYGPCLIIPGKKFDPDSEDPLETQGYRVINMDFRGEAVTLVKLTKRKTSSEDSEKVVFEPPAGVVSTSPVSEDEPIEEQSKDEEQAEVKRGRGRKLTVGFSRWTADDKAKLLRLWEETPGTGIEKSAALVAQFPNRTAKALDLQHLKLLHKKGQKLKKTKQTKHWVDIPDGPEKTDKKESEPEKTPVKEVPGVVGTILDSIKSLARAIDKLTVLVAEDHLLHEKLSCQVMMHCLEINEVEGEFKIPLSLKLLLKNALLSNDGIHCAVFKARVTQFLEAVRPPET